NIEVRTKELTHVVEVIGYLQSILDFDKGGQVARNLSNFYNLMRAKLMEVHIAPTQTGLEMLGREFAKVGAAWRQAEQAASQPGATAAAVPEIQMVAPTNASTANEGHLVAMDR